MELEKMLINVLHVTLNVLNVPSLAVIAPVVMSTTSDLYQLMNAYQVVKQPNITILESVLPVRQAVLSAQGAT